MRKNFILILTVLSVNAFAQTAGIVNKGKNIYVSKDATSGDPSLYVNGKIQVEGKGNITQNGRTQVTGNFINNVSEGNVFNANSTGTVEFVGKTLQQTISGTAKKAVNFIDFPNLRVYNPNAVVLSPDMGASVNDLILDKGRFVIDSKVKDTKLVTNAHLLVKNDVTYQKDMSIIHGEKGVVQVNLAMGDNYENRKIIGFTPPFAKIHADYFFFNFLSRPVNDKLLGENKELITDPHYTLEAGKGYLIGQGIVKDDKYYFDNLYSGWQGAKYEDRFQTMFSFAREFGKASLTQFVNYANASKDEILNVQDVNIKLEAGWNFLGNPFTAPLDLSTFVNDVTAADEWGVTRAKVNNSSKPHVRAAFYVLSGGEGTYTPEHKEEPYKFNVSYLLAQKEGSTLQLGGLNTDKLLIAPMQMFVVGVYDAGAGQTLRIPKAKRTHGDVHFYRSRSAEENSIVNELLIEVKDNTTQGFDRLTVVFRDGASLQSNDQYDAQKMFNRSKGVSQIYTMSSDNKYMTANVVNSTTESVIMCLEPTSQAQQVTLSAHRLNSLSSVNKIVLEDLVTKTQTDIYQNPEYTFTSSPSDRTDRFVLHFLRNVDGIEDYINTSVEMYAHYEAGNLRIMGLAESDLNSVISVYDIHGRMAYQGKVSETPRMDVNVQLVKGTYLVKLAGKRTGSFKLLVNQ